MYENRHGRFTAVDPLLASGNSATPQTFNRFVYVMNAPTRITDPSGECPTGSCPLIHSGTVYTRTDENGHTWYNDEGGEGWEVYNGAGLISRGDEHGYAVVTWAGWSPISTEDAIEMINANPGILDNATGLGANRNFHDDMIDALYGYLFSGANAAINFSNTFYGVTMYRWTNKVEDIPYVEPFRPFNQIQREAMFGMDMAITTASILSLRPTTTAARTPSFTGFVQNSGGRAAFTPPTVQLYQLEAAADGYYPVMTRGFADPTGSVFLKRGDVWKFGETINPGTRYSQRFLDTTGEGLIMSRLGRFDFKSGARAAERSEIISYEGRFGRLPAGNKQRN